MRTNDRLQYNVTGQTHVYRVTQGRPDASPVPTYFVVREYMTDDSTAEFSGNATIDSFTQPLTAAAGPSQADPSKIVVASTTGIDRTQLYWLHENAMQEWVAPIEIESGYIRTRHGLANSFTTAAVLDSTQLSWTVDSTFITSKVKVNVQPDPNPGYRVVWLYYVSGVQYRAYSFFTVVRSRMPHSVVSEDLEARAHGLAASMPDDHRAEQLRAVIDAAYQVVQSDLAGMDLNPDAFRDTQVIDEMTIRASLVLLAQGGWRPLGFQSVSEYYKVVQESYSRFFEQRVKVVLKNRIAFGIAGEAEQVFVEASWAK